MTPTLAFTLTAVRYNLRVQTHYDFLFALPWHTKRCGGLTGGL